MVIFVRKAAEGALTEGQIRDTFKKADRDGDGRLSKEELKQAFRQLGAHVPDWRVFRGLHHADVNKDGLIETSGFELDILVEYAFSKYAYKF